MKSFEKGWKPRSIWARLLTMVAGLLALIMAVLAYCMMFPVRVDGLGIIASYALFYPLHLLLFTVVAAAMAYIALRSRARLAAWVSGFVLILTMLMGLIPTFSIVERARELGVPVSLGNYLANAGHSNSGHPQTDRSVSYGTAKDGARLELDVWRTGQPNTGPLRPAIVFVHGGGWVLGNRSGRPDWNRWLNQLGYEVFDVEYRMPPPVRWRDEIGDVKAAVGWVAAHAADYHVDPARISMMGHSAGGNLVMLAAYTMGDPELPPSTNVAPVAIRSVINLYGPTEMAMLYRSSPSRDFVQTVEKQYIGGTPEELPERYRALSPLYRVSTQTPPTITFHGTIDRVVPLDQATTLDQALSKAGVAHETYLLPGNDHGFDINWCGFSTQIARAKIEAFLQRH
jgi:acetyl esterase/lipase